MSSSVETVHLSPLNGVHEQLGATMADLDGWSTPLRYRDHASEYAAVREHAGVMDLSSRGRLRVSGSEAIQFLNGLITNDVKTLPEHTWMAAALPNVQGRLLAAIRVVRLADAPAATFLIDTEPRTAARVKETLERFTLAGDFNVADLSNNTALVSVQGKESRAFVATVIGEAVPELPDHGSAITKWRDSEVTVFRSSHTGEDGFDLIVSSDSAAALWQALVDAGVRPAGHETLETLRIEAGIPRFGIDMDESNVVTETNLDDAVSYTKGCYVGQEIIARIKYRGHVAKKLTGLSFDGNVDLARGAVVKFEDKEIGRVTSATFSPTLKHTIAMAYLKYDYLGPGTIVSVSTSDGDAVAHVTGLPFLSRSGAAE